MNIVKSAVSIGLLASAVVLSQGCATIGAPPMNDTRFSAVQAGMTNDEVRASLGEPRRTTKFPGSGNTAWDYEGTDTWGYMVEYSVTFSPDGRVASKLARRMNDGGDRK